MPNLKRLFPLIPILCLLVLVPRASGQGSQRVVQARGYLSVDAVTPGGKVRVAIELEVTAGYHINAHVPSLDYLRPTDVSFEPPAGVTIGVPTYPPPVQRTFDFAPETPLAVHEGTIIITAEGEAASSMKPGTDRLRAAVQVQACNDALCLAPAVLNVEIPLRVAAAGSPPKQANSEVFARATTAPGTSAVKPAAGLVQYQGDSPDSNLIAAALAKGGLLAALPVIFLAGLLLNLTPCVYPIIPITIGFFVNQSASHSDKPSIKRTFGLAAMYVIGMAITYSLLGVIAAKSGGLFGAALQKPAVLIGLALLMLALSLSMFGVYEFRMPESLNRLANKSAQSTSGLVGALVMGLTMGIVAAPCIGPFVLALLAHVAAKGDALYGFFLFFVLALGLGLPYLILGTFSGSLKSLPRSGLWMVTIRNVFGVVLIGMALYFLAPLLGAASRYFYIAFFALSALYLLIWEARGTKPRQIVWALRLIGLGAAAVAVVLALPRKIESEIAWQPYSEKALQTARAEGKGVIIDTFADWCIPCKELDHNTFNDGRVKEEAEQLVTLKLDLTQADSNSEGGRARERFSILGVPTVIFIDSSGQERADLRLEGFEKPDAFLARLKKLERPGASARLVPAAEVKTGSGEQAPPANLKLLEGGTLDLASLHGKVVLLDFWATWCLPCVSEIPLFNQLSKEYGPKGVEVLGVSLDADGASKVKPFLKEHPMAYTQVLGDSEAARAFDVDDEKLPVTLLIDRQGTIRFRHVGITKKGLLEGEIGQLVNE